MRMKTSRNLFALTPVTYLVAGGFNYLVLVDKFIITLDKVTLILEKFTNTTEIVTNVVDKDINELEKFLSGKK